MWLWGQSSTNKKTTSNSNYKIDQNNQPKAGPLKRLLRCINLHQPKGEKDADVQNSEFKKTKDTRKLKKSQKNIMKSYSLIK